MASKVSGIVEQIQLGLDGDPKAIASTAYGYCETAAGTAAKTVDMTGFELTDGVTVAINFANASTSTTAPTLNINNTGAKSIYMNGVAVLNGWNAGATLIFTYDETSDRWNTGVNSLHGLTRKSLTTTTINTNNTTDIIQSSSAGKFFGKTSNIDWVGLQISSSVDRFQLVAQLVADANTLIFRQNDNATVKASNWSAWQQFVHTNFNGGVGGAGEGGDKTAGSESVATPVYVAANGTATPIAYTIGADVPIGAVFTDHYDWGDITSKPTTVSGYGITDAKTVQTAVTDPTVPGTGTNEADAFIDTISQNTNGEISATKKYIPVKNVYIPYIPNTTDENTSIVTDREAFIPYANTSSYGVVKVNATGSSTTVPVYIDTSGLLKKCSTYAGGTKVTLNGANKGGKAASLYAPTTSGNSGELLISSGASTAPAWTENGIFSSNTWIFKQKLKINPGDNDSNSQNLYVHGTTYIDDATQIGTIIINPSSAQQSTITTVDTSRTDLILNPSGKLQLYQTSTDTGATPTARVILDQDTFYPYANNQVSLGIDNHYWKELYATTIVTTPAGSSTKPIYIASTGEIAESSATVGSQYQPVYLNSGTITAAYPVQYLSWTFANANDNQVVFSNQLFTASTYVLSIVVTSGESNLKGPITWTSGAGTLTLSTSPVTGVVSGYMLISFGADLSSTISGTSSNSNT